MKLWQIVLVTLGAILLIGISFVVKGVRYGFHRVFFHRLTRCTKCRIPRKRRRS